MIHAVGGPDSKEAAIFFELTHSEWTHRCKHNVRQRQLENWKKQGPRLPAIEAFRDPSVKDPDKVGTSLAMLAAFLNVKHKQWCWELIVTLPVGRRRSDTCSRRPH